MHIIVGRIFCDGINTWLSISLKRDFFLSKTKQRKTKKVPVLSINSQITHFWGIDLSLSGEEAYMLCILRTTL
jgi:hypothetical protein